MINFIFSCFRFPFFLIGLALWIAFTPLAAIFEIVVLVLVCIGIVAMCLFVPIKFVAAAFQGRETLDDYLGEIGELVDFLKAMPEHVASWFELAGDLKHWLVRGS